MQDQTRYGEELRKRGLARKAEQQWCMEQRKESKHKRREREEDRKERMQEREEQKALRAEEQKLHQSFTKLLVLSMTKK